VAVTVFKTFIAGEVLTASDLNSSLTQLTNNGMDLWSPATESADFDGQKLILDSDADTSITADTDDQIDFELVGADNFRMLLDGSIPDFRAEWADAGATVGPYISLYRNSATPADEDFVGEFRFLGEDSDGNTEEYATIACQLADVTAGTEDARIQFNLKSGGTKRNILQFDSGADMRLRDFSADATAGPVFIMHRDSASPADADIGPQIDFDMENDASEQITYASIRAVADDVTDGTEDGHLVFSSMIAGTETDSLSPGILYAATATTSGTAHTLAIPAGARELVVTFAGVSTDGTNPLGIELGDSGGLETSGYVGTRASTDDTVTNSGNFTANASLTIALVSARTYSGRIDFTLLDSSTNTWAFSSTVGADDTDDTIYYMAGSKSLDTVLTQISLVAGGDTFDGGKIGLLVK